MDISAQYRFDSERPEAPEGSFIGCDGSAKAIAAAIGDELGHPDRSSKS